jgi:hypothetical protein
MPAPKMQNESEFRRWYEQGRTYNWMVEEYARKYHIETTPTMFSNYRRRLGLPARSVSDTSLVPWSVRPEHRREQHYIMLTQEARRRAGKPLKGDKPERLESWQTKIAELGEKAGGRLVVHYEPDLHPGFRLVPAREGIDNDLVRVPDKTDRRGGNE